MLMAEQSAVWQSAGLQVGLGESVGIWRAPGQKNNDPKP